jgi:protocatechuate 3,4-dioxygenase beta subunit
MFISALRATPVRNFCLTVLVACSAFLSSSLAQLPVSTSRGDNARSGANTSETLLTPTNVSKNSFGRLFSFPVDYVVMAQPLYVPNVNIPGQGTHNVIYVVTEMDSVYAIDADTGAQLWYASMLNVGGTTASGKYLPCGHGPGFLQEGITSTPVIDLASNTMYLVAKTLLNTTVRHHLHALDITTGNEQVGSPVLITATSTSNKGHVTVFDSKHQKNRPGLLLLNGILYLGFGSNYCNDGDAHGWVLSYDAATLSQLAVFNSSPDYGLASIWQAGNGLAADASGNIFVETAETGAPYDVPNGGQTFCNSVLKLAPDLTVADYFTPWSVAYLNAHDLDLSSTGALVLPDQDGPYPHELIASGKQGIVYVLNRDSLGMFSTNDSQVLQEVTLESGVNYYDVLFGSLAYWNNTVYFAPNASPLLAFPLSGGLLGTPLKTSGTYNGSHSPSISANGNSNGVLWVITGQLLAFDAVSLKLLYTTNQAPNGRDTLPPVGHFVTQTVANGKVYVGTRNSLEAYGLFHVVTITGGNAQKATVATALPAPINVNAANPYNGQPDVGATVNFSDGGKGGSFNPASAITDANGNASTTYTVPQKTGTYTLTISGSGFGNVTTTATATPGAAVRMIAYGGARQTAAAGSSLANPVVAQVQDIYKNGVPGVTINFTANMGAVPNPSSVVTDANGLARTTLQLPTTVSTVTVTASSTGFKNVAFLEYSVAGPAANIAITGGNNQSATAGTQLPQGLTVLVTDQYANPVPNVSVAFDDGGAGGSYSYSNPGITSNSGTVTQFYTLPTSARAIAITATATGVASTAVFSENSLAGPAARIAATGGNNQTAPAGTQLPQALTVLVTDQNNNPVAGVTVSFADGGAGGAFSNPNPGVTDNAGSLAQFYTLPPLPGIVTITATATGVATPAVFTETAQ